MTKAKCKTGNKERYPDLTKGKTYEVLSDKDEWIEIKDDTGEAYCYPKTLFDVKEDPSPVILPRPKAAVNKKK